MPERNSSSASKLGLAMFFAVISVSVSAYAQTESVIHSFLGTNQHDGSSPLSGVIADPSGALYGATQHGGAHGYGAVYKLTPPTVAGGVWKEAILYSFTGGGDGAYPQGNLLLYRNVLYGTTQQGGPRNAGVVYQLAHTGGTWSESVIYGFTGLKDGKFPVAGLVVDNKGALYGTTTNGGNFSGNPEGYGVVFRLSYSAGVGWTEGVLHAFQGTDGGDPNSSLLRDSTGAFYGSTYQNGQYGFGSIFKLAPPTSGGGAWTETILYSFQDGNDGGYPVGTPALDSTGAVYGTTSDGGQYGRGNVFKLSPPSGGSGSWTESVLYAFQNGSDGGYPQDGVVLDASGNVYGTTLGGGDGLGVVFELLPPSGGSGAWTEVVLHSFTGGADGGSPYTPVLLLGADLYGTTWSGGTGNGGTVFQIMP